MSNSQGFIFGCGGTGGHIYPGVALAQELRKQKYDVLFVGNQDGMENAIVTAEGFSFRGLHVQKLYRKFCLSNLKFPLLLVSSIIKSVLIIRQYKPRGVICTGGFVAAPVAIASIIVRVPLFFHESNCYPGITTRFLARFTRITFTSFAGTARYLKNANIVQLGIPIPARKSGEAMADLSEIGLNAGSPVILVTGGSQGSQAINSVIDAALTSLLKEGFQVIWQTGKTGFQQYSAKYSDTEGVHIFDFSPMLANFYKFATVAVTRAGALTAAELEENHLPAVMIPLPTAAENHQYYNALEQQKRGLALLIKQSDLNAQSLKDSLKRIMKNYDGYKNRFPQTPNTAAKDVTEAILAYLDKEIPNAGKN